MTKRILLILSLLSISLFSNEIIMHYDVIYKEVVSPNTGKVWLDRNLGAKEVCTSVNDKQCFGNYYQWGRNQDGHEQYNSRVVLTLAKSISSAGKYFINAYTNDYHDWSNSLDSDGKLRIDQWSKKDGSSICPKGYTVPTLSELQKEANGNMSLDFLKLPSAGRRDEKGNMINGSFGSIWVNTASISYSKFLYYDTEGTIDFGRTERDNGFNVRCIKN